MKFLSILFLLFACHLSGMSAVAAGCLEDQRALVNVTAPVFLTASDKKEVTAQVISYLRNAGFVLLDNRLKDNALVKRQKDLIAKGDVVGALDLAKKLDSTILVNVVITGHSRKVRGIAEGLFNNTVQVAMTVYSTTDGTMLSAVRKVQRKLGLELSSQISIILDSLMPQIVQQSVSEICSRISVNSSTGRNDSTLEKIPRPESDNHEGAIDDL